MGVHLAEALVSLNGLAVALARALELAKLGVKLVLRVRVYVALLAAFAAGNFDSVKRGHRGVHSPLLNERAHVAEEEGEQKGANVGAVDVGVCHHNDLAVARRGKVEGPPASRPDHLDDLGDLFVFEDIRRRSLLDVEDFAADGKKGLEFARPRELGGSQG